MNSNFNCSYMAMSSLTYILGFSVRFFSQFIPFRNIMITRGSQEPVIADGPLPKLCPAVTLSHQDGHHSAVVLLLKAALIQVSDYRLLGASGLISHFGQRAFWKRTIQ
jgi:hypothetical protein